MWMYIAPCQSMRMYAVFTSTGIYANIMYAVVCSCASTIICNKCNVHNKCKAECITGGKGCVLPYSQRQSNVGMALIYKVHIQGGNDNTGP